jgi:hypothetical protein
VLTACEECLSQASLGRADHILSTWKSISASSDRKLGWGDQDIEEKLEEFTTAAFVKSKIRLHYRCAPHCSSNSKRPTGWWYFAIQK